MKNFMDLLCVLHSNKNSLFHKSNFICKFAELQNGAKLKYNLYLDFFERCMLYEVYAVWLMCYL